MRSAGHCQHGHEDERHGIQGNPPQAGRNPDDKRLSDLVGELSTKSDAFRTRWAAHNVRYHDRGTKRLHHPVVGDLTLDFEAMELSADAGLVMFAYTAVPGSKSPNP